ncbi:4EBP1 protein, partial [Tyrannus savana]|nr:4EBP1 protein [Tyrannus savana]
RSPSSSPGQGHLTTLLCPPPGTRIIYDRKFLMECRNSPVAKTPPSDLPDIPGVTSPSVEELKLENHHVQNCEEKASAGECRQQGACEV